MMLQFVLTNTMHIQLFALCISLDAAILNKIQDHKVYMIQEYMELGTILPGSYQVMSTDSVYTILIVVLHITF
jgi:hypothetical protein